MAPKSKKPLETIEDMYEDGSTEIIKETKFNNILSAYKNCDTDYLCTIYKFIDRKKVIVDRLSNQVPDPIIDLKNKYGGGTFRIYIHKEDTGELLETADTHVIETKPEENKTNSSRIEILNELEKMSSIVNKSDHKNDTDILIRIMEMNAQQFKELAKMQMESKEETTRLIMKMQEQMISKKSDLSEMIEIFNTINSLKDNSETGIIEKIISSPIVGNILTNLTGNNVTQQMLPQNTQQHQQPTIDELINMLPDEFKDKITIDNADQMVKFLYEKNKDKIGIDVATNIIFKILENKSKNEN